MITTPVADIFIDEEFNIMRVVFRDVEEMNIKEAMEHAEGYSKVANGKKYPVLLDTRNTNVNISPHAREFMAKADEVNAARIAQAILINSFPKRLIARFYIRFNKPPVPMEVFDKEHEALEWLMKYSEKDNIPS